MFGFRNTFGLFLQNIADHLRGYHNTSTFYGIRYDARNIIIGRFHWNHRDIPVL